MNPARKRDDLAEWLLSCRQDPLRYVLGAWDWGHGDLESYHGPRTWQAEMFAEVGRHLREQPGQVFRGAWTTGHGVGKSAGVAMLSRWALDTFVDTRVIITANTDTQLKTKTAPELAKWHRLSLTAGWWNAAATSIASTAKGHEKTWRLDLIPWNETRPESVQGAHNQGKRLVLIFDEASAIPDAIWEAYEGALTDADTEILWLVFGNPTRNTGRFHRCFHRDRDRWHTVQLDSRTIEGTNKQELQGWVDAYGEDSDFVRIRVRGVFPRAGLAQFIPTELAEKAARREPRSLPTDPMLMGIDVARSTGRDQTVIRMRKGMDAQTYPTTKLRINDTMRIAAIAAELYQQWGVDCAFVDGIGVGAGVYDRLSQLGLDVIYVDSGSTECEAGFANMRAAMWGRMKKALMAGLAIENDQELIDDLTGIEFGHNGRDEIQLESVDHMVERGLHSPDDATALALMFAYPVMPMELGGGVPGMQRGGTRWDYDPYESR